MRRVRTWPIGVKSGTCNSLVHWLMSRMAPNARRPIVHAFVLEAAVEPASRLSTARLKKNGATRPAGGVGVSSALDAV